MGKNKIEFIKCNSKGDFMMYCQQNDLRIKEIDSAIPAEYTKTLNILTIDPSMFCIVYYKNSTTGIINVIEEAAKLFINK